MPRPLRPKEIDELLVPPAKASMLLTDHQTIRSSWFQVKPYISSQSTLTYMHGSIFGLLWPFFECHVILILSKNSLSGWQRHS